MKKIIYIIPGLGERCNLLRYKKLANALKKRGYVVNCINPDWYKPLTKQTFCVEKDALICGFSFGGVLAYLVAIKHPCKKVIFASLSPIHTFSLKSLVDDFVIYMGINMAKTLAKDIKNIKISLETLKTPYISLVGEHEDLHGDLIVPSTGHFMTRKYIECIAKLV